MERIKNIRIILIIAATIAMFSNLSEIVSDSGNTYRFILYVCVILTVDLLLIFVGNKWVVSSLFVAVGALTILDSGSPVNISGGVVFLIFATRINDNKIFTLITMFLTMLVVGATFALEPITVMDAINMVMIYTVIFYIEYILDHSEAKDDF